MPNLALVQLTPGVMTDNLERALSQPSDKPWAFVKFTRQMKGLQPDVYIAFVHVLSPTGGPLGRSGSVALDCQIDQLVIGRLTRSITEAPTAAPFFDGFPHEFWYDLVANVPFDSAQPLVDVADVMNAQVPGLDPREQLVAALKRVAEPALLTQEYLALRLQLWSLATAHPDFAAINARAHERYRARLTDLVREAQPSLSRAECRARAADVDVVQNGLWLSALLGVDRAAVRRALERTEAIALG